jgi:hypothetical protein
MGALGAGANWKPRGSIHHVSKDMTKAVHNGTPSYAHFLRCPHFEAFQNHHDLLVMHFH